LRLNHFESAQFWCTIGATALRLAIASYQGSDSVMITRFAFYQLPFSQSEWLDYHQWRKTKVLAH
jgi:hypothetical protein